MSAQRLDSKRKPVKSGGEVVPLSASQASSATALVRIAQQEATLFHTPDHEGYADVLVNDHRETWALRSPSFRRWLSGRFYAHERKAPTSQALADAMSVLEGDAIFSSPEVPVFVRLASAGGSIYLDLADEEWSAIETTPQGWDVVASAPVRFRRPRGMRPLPRPTRGGSLDSLLRPFVNAPSQEVYRLCVGWLLNALRDRGPYLIAVIQGESGSAKSTLARLLRNLIDPSTVPLRRPPFNERELAICANNGWVVAFDNLSGLQPWLSDALCSLATGGGFGTRELYTDSGEVLFDATRPIIINGIDDLLTRSDLTDRSVVFNLPQIPEEDRRPEATIWQEFDVARPQILGSLLDGVSAALRRVESVNLARLPRMADAARWITAAEPALGWEPGSFLRAYAENRGEAVELGLESDPVAGAVRALISPGAVWCGTASELLKALRESVPGGQTCDPALPGTPKVLSGRLRRLAPSLRASGIGLKLDFREPGTRRRLIRLWRGGRDGADSCGPCVPSGPAQTGEPLAGNAEQTAGGTLGPPRVEASCPQMNDGTAGNAGFSAVVPPGRTP